MLKKYLFLTLVVFFFVVITVPTAVNAQNNSSGVAVPVNVSGEVKDGFIICSSDTGQSACNRSYEPNIFGVIVEKPAVSFQTEKINPGEYPVLSSGKVYVQVSGESGAINPGDFVTTSTVAGVGQKAIKSGYVLGSAIDSFTRTTKDDRGKILVSISIRSVYMSKGAGANLYELIKEGIDGAFLSP